MVKNRFENVTSHMDKGHTVFTRKFFVFLGARKLDLPRREEGLDPIYIMFTFTKLIKHYVERSKQAGELKMGTSSMHYPKLPGI